MHDHYLNLDPFGKEGELRAIIDTPKGSRNKYTFDDELGIFALAGVLPAGAVFPFDFGYLPGTLAEDGDPMDVLVLLDSPAFVGCLVPSRLVGIVKAEQTEGGVTERNDRLIAVPLNSRNHADVKSIDDLPGNLIDEIEHFFFSYNAAKGKEFRVIGRGDAAAGRKLIREAAEAFKNA